ncbi:tyrosine recombinase XerC [Methanobrevibacter cuticularis]|uniref:Tyrosine recombinase XerC n=1 Tax=Methanobrevibacter cuticularis TaxID=47311 RepID=A0A166EGC9_9EURY|nr:site-specific tyrosine recombinase/integron integrase [Methanobrevibacter cuticularis]KZX16622.1 tyrosine recombinase XerC [Methanobrevibacter cuticularis]
MTNILSSHHVEPESAFISKEKQDIIEKIQGEMKGKLTQEQTKYLNQVLINCLANIEILDKMMNDFNTIEDNENLLKIFISSKKIEGRSKRTLKYYKDTIEKMLLFINKPIANINTDDIRNYFIHHQEATNVTNVTLNNIRRNLSSFFGWLRDEGYVLNNPITRIKPIKTDKIIKKPFNDVEIEKLRTHIHRNKQIRDLAIFETLLSTGVRISELVGIKISDIDFNNRTILVFGKGAKERIVFFNAKAKIAIEEYLETRKDNSPELFVAEKKPFNSLGISGVERRVRDLGLEIGIPNVHPHRFRRTMATNALNSGMAIEEIKELLGHENVDTTLIYANVDQNNVKHAYNKHMGG